MGNRGKQRQVLLNGVQDCAQLFYLPQRVPNSLFDGLDNDKDVPIPIGTEVNSTDTDIEPAQPE